MEKKTVPQEVGRIKIPAIEIADSQYYDNLLEIPELLKQIEEHPDATHIRLSYPDDHTSGQDEIVLLKANPS